VISISARATVTNEGCNDGIDNDGDGLVDGANPDCAPPPPTGNTCGEVRGDGLLTTNRDFLWEFYKVKYVQDAPKPSGQASFNDRKNKVKFTSTSIDTLVISGNPGHLDGQRNRERRSRDVHDRGHGQPGHLLGPAVQRLQRLGRRDEG
jgi:hypothetical protein